MYTINSVSRICDSDLELNQLLIDWVKPETQEKYRKRFNAKHVRVNEQGVYCIGRTIVKDIGRNDPCYCGSGKKYKKCCGK